jgi:hypothetical protein
MLHCRGFKDIRLSDNAMVQGFSDSVDGIAGETCAQADMGDCQHVCRLEAVYLHGCRLAWLPPALLATCTDSLQFLMLSNNRLQGPLPDVLVHLKALQKLHLYGNLLQELPHGLVIGCKRLSYLLLEDNPLSTTQLDALLGDVQLRESSGTPLRVVGLDAGQVRNWQANKLSLDRRRLPQCVQSGWLMMPGSRWYGKLRPSS